MPRGSKPGERRGGRRTGATNKKTQGKVALAKLMTKEGASEQKLPVPYLLEIMNSRIPPNAHPTVQVVAMQLKFEAGKALLPYFSHRKGEEKPEPPKLAERTGDEHEITYDAARRILFALTLLEREGDK